mgnify:CR=1 FL=1
MNPLTPLRRGVALTGLAAALAVLPVRAETITMASTTSTEQSGLFGQLLPAFKAASGIDVKVVAQGTGQALDTARRGDADVVFVHDQAAEEKFVADGYAAKRYPVMYNDFVLIGPAPDPAGAPDAPSLRVPAAPPSGVRLDKALAEAFPTLSRARLQALLAEGAVTRDGQVVSGGSAKAQAGLYAVVLPPVATSPVGSAMPSVPADLAGDRGGGAVMAVDIDEPALLRALGEAITTRREELGLSQRALGLEAGVERNMLRGVEDGSRRATIITLARIAEALKVPISQLLHQIGH